MGARDAGQRTSGRLWGGVSAYLLAGEADVGDGWSDVPNGNIPFSLTTMLLHLAPRLRRVVFVGDAALGARFDQAAADRVSCGLRAPATRR
jgi:hypothetical protein